MTVVTDVFFMARTPPPSGVAASASPVLNVALATLEDSYTLPGHPWPVDGADALSPERP
jgi:hypothetical protein